MDSVAKIVAAAEQEADGGDMFSFRLLAAIASLLAAAAWQPRGKFSKAKALLATAMSHLHLAAKHVAVDLKARSCSSWVFKPFETCVYFDLPSDYVHFIS